MPRACHRVVQEGGVVQVVQEVVVVSVGRFCVKEDKVKSVENSGRCTRGKKGLTKS